MFSKRLLGYGGSASIAGTQLFITSGNFDEAFAPSYLEMIDTPPATSPVSRVQHADGTAGYTGSLSFDIYDAAMSTIFTTSTLLGRYYQFDVGINDGTSDWQMVGCKATSLSLTGTVGGLVTAQVSFLAKTGKQAGATPHAFLRDVEPLAYWYTGTGPSDNIKEWTLSMNQTAELIYKNENSIQPAYIKVGGVSYSLAVTSYENLFPAGTTTPITIGTSSFTLTGRPTARGFSFGGITDIGSYSYTFETSSQTGKSDAVVIS